MDAALIASATLLGLAGTPHCAAMCSAPCAAVTGAGGWRSVLPFHVARTASYALGGAVVASTTSGLARWSQISPAVRPIWVLLNALALALGLWLLWRGRAPAWLAGLGRSPVHAAAAGGWQTLRGPAKAAGYGALWVAWPCGLLQSGLLVAALCGSAASGALAMGGFALASAPGLVFGPWVAGRLMRSRGGQIGSWAPRAAGLLMVCASSWALGHGIWKQVAAYCLSL